MVKHKAGVENKVVDALSRRVSLLSVMSVKVTRFDSRMTMSHAQILESSTLA